ncbi:putative glycosyl transferase [Pedobacter glucosidilyticus]|nr:glycosyltransferase family 4 protein [Pedobacter glucosidilyticus]KHJ39133.1 putative glycosyl transferase [Pedobacter glucosidilyticus]
MSSEILIVSCVFDPEPVVSASITKDLAHSLKFKENVTVITPKPSRPYGFSFKEIDFQKVSSFKLLRLNSYTYPKKGIIGRMFESISFGFASYKYIMKEHHDFRLVYMNTWPIFSQLGVVLACNAKKIPYIVHIQDVYPESLTNRIHSNTLKSIINAILFPLEQKIIRDAKKVVAISNNMKKYLAKTRNVSLEKIDVVINWQDELMFNSYKDFWPCSKEKITFMYLGNIGPVAGVDFLINAFAKSKIKATLIIAGSGSEKEKCIKKASEFYDADITFIDVPTGKVAETQALAHVLLLPTKINTGNNSIPSKLPAYMFSARPIIALTDKFSDIAQSIEKAECGWVGPPEDEEWLIKCFKNLTILDQNILKEKGQSGLRFAKQVFSREKNLTHLVEIISK